MKILRTLVFLAALLIGEFCMATPPLAISQSPDEQDSNEVVVGVLSLHAKDWKEGPLTGEIIPIAVYSNGSYSDAIIIPGFTDKLRETPLERFRDYTLSTSGRALAGFRVESVSDVPYGCDSMRMGLGRLTGNSSFEELDREKKRLRAQRTLLLEPPDPFHWKEPAALALSDKREAPIVEKDWNVPLEEIKEDVIEVAGPYLMTTTFAYVGAATREGIKVMEISMVDLDHDQNPEVCGTVTQNVWRERDENGYSPSTVIWGVIWLSFRGDKPTVLGKMRPETEEIDYSKGTLQFVDIIDIGGDGLDEVIMLGHGYEWAWYEIYELQDNQLVRVFKGSSFGC